ncbi:putative acetyltransferase [Sphingomonas prati]|uniref:Putative acetyltransferase n=2 Tax=Sphingomonas prati TaxID=1843237 RepID=A0A7W9BQ65_9SPHN|nr:GNAT family N-acetyltransferase [Sphingomonas prati]MBB5727929.1 putative acetyltransferase [Sphingomonas prati]
MDLDAAAEVWRESALNMDGHPYVPPLELMRRRVAQEFKAGWQLYVALRADRVVGLLALKPVDAVLDQIFVVPNEQGKGVGRVLLEVAKRAMPTGFRLRMTATNERAGRFYEAEGLNFVDKGLHPSSGMPVHVYEWNQG